MSTLGLRMGWVARRKLRTELLGATYSAKTCARDGIRMALKVQALLDEEQGRHLLRFFDSESHWSIELLPEALDLAASYRLLPTDGERASLLECFRTVDESRLMEIKQLEGS